MVRSPELPERVIVTCNLKVERLNRDEEEAWQVPKRKRRRWLFLGEFWRRL
jgi:hypothetical protein